MSQLMNIKTSDSLMLSLQLEPLIQYLKLQYVIMDDETEIMIV